MNEYDINHIFSTHNWNKFQNVSVTAFDDDFDEDDIHTDILGHHLDTLDLFYRRKHPSGRGIKDVTVSIMDDDTARVLIQNHTGGTMKVHEDIEGRHFSYSIKLASMPAIWKRSNPSRSCTKRVDQIGRNNPYWNQEAVSVTFEIFKGHCIEIQQTEKRDCNAVEVHRFSQLCSPTTNIFKGTVSITGNLPNEWEFENPSHTRPCTYKCSEESKATISHEVVSFSPSNWNIGQAVTITAIDDKILESFGGKTFHSTVLQHSTHSKDPLYNVKERISNPVIHVQITDNDRASITTLNEFGVPLYEFDTKAYQKWVQEGKPADKFPETYDPNRGDKNITTKIIGIKLSTKPANAIVFNVSVDRQVNVAMANKIARINQRSHTNEIIPNAFIFNRCLCVISGNV